MGIPERRACPFGTDRGDDPRKDGVVQMAGFSFLQFFVVFSLPCFVCVVLVALYPVGVRKESLETVAVKLLKLEK